MRTGTKLIPLILALIGLANVSPFHAAQGAQGGHLAPPPPPLPTHFLVELAPPQVCLLEDNDPVLIEICSTYPLPNCFVVSADNHFDGEGRCLVYCNFHCDE